MGNSSPQSVSFDDLDAPSLNLTRLKILVAVNRGNYNSRTIAADIGLAHSTVCNHLYFGNGSTAPTLYDLGLLTNTPGAINSIRLTELGKQIADRYWLTRDGEQVLVGETVRYD